MTFHVDMNDNLSVYTTSIPSKGVCIHTAVLCICGEGSWNRDMLFNSVYVLKGNYLCNELIFLIFFCH